MIRFYAEIENFDNATVTAASAESAYPVSALQHPHRSYPYRSTGVSGDQYIQWDAGIADGIYASYIAIIDHNLGGGQFRLVASNNADMSSPVLDRRFWANSPLFGYGEGGFGEHGFGGILQQSEAARYTPGNVRIYHFGLEPDPIWDDSLPWDDTQFWVESPPKPVAARYWRLYLIDTSLSYYEVARIILGQYFQPLIGFDLGYSLVPIDDSTVDYSEGGQPWADIKPKRRGLRFEFRRVDLDDSLWNFFDLLHYRGRRQDIIVSMFPDDPVKCFFHTLYGRFDNLAELVGAGPNQDSIGSLLFKESL